VEADSGVVESGLGCWRRRVPRKVVGTVRFIGWALSCLQTSNFRFTPLDEDREGLEGILQSTSIQRRGLCALSSGSR